MDTQRSTTSPFLKARRTNQPIHIVLGKHTREAVVENLDYRAGPTGWKVQQYGWGVFSVCAGFAGGEAERDSALFFPM